MQLFRATSNLSGSQDCCAQDLVDTVPLVMRVIRGHMRRHRSGLTIPQFRTLCYISVYDRPSLSDAADFIGLSLPAMSRLVDGLVEKQLMRRRPCDDDRRHVRLSVTPKGHAALTGARQLAQSHLAEALQTLSPEQRESISQAMQTLREIFNPELVQSLAADDSPD
jgi:DNA-binding MarR family transcriptional regulator